ncbi:hypothetical protein C4580_01070 [Candidatus Woesearchaeota archaeon]|nr:MAG: hypothetical protein C4580_01070 [Candidatus Woesearchaeota archaeon]
MKKELIFLFLFLLPLLLLAELINFNTATGDVTHDLAIIRLERLQLARSPFYGRIDAECRAYIRTIDQYLRLGADERYYTPTGLSGNPGYYINERTLLQHLSDMQHPNTPCSPALKTQAAAIAANITAQNVRLGNYTLSHRTCTPDAKWYFDQAVFLSTREPISAINYLEHTVSLC